MASIPTIVDTLWTEFRWGIEFTMLDSLQFTVRSSQVLVSQFAIQHA
jgi:hypothetical protein